VLYNHCAAPLCECHQIGQPQHTSFVKVTASITCNYPFPNKFYCCNVRYYVSRIIFYSTHHCASAVSLRPQSTATNDYKFQRNYTFHKWDMTPCMDEWAPYILVHSYQCFGGSFCLHFQGNLRRLSMHVTATFVKTLTCASKHTRRHIPHVGNVHRYI
jgi:hypothetical protein